MFARHADGTVVRAFTALGWVLAWLSIKNKHEPGFRAEDRTNFVVFNKYTGGNHFELTWLDGDNDDDDDDDNDMASPAVASESYAILLLEND